MLHRMRSRESTRQPNAPGPAFMTKDQVADYLTDLRSHRVSRPGGSRPLPAKDLTQQQAPSRPLPSFVPSMKVPSKASHGENTSRSSHEGTVPGVTSPHRRAQSALDGRGSMRGRSMIPTPEPQLVAREYSAPAHSREDVHDVAYIERGHRWMERQETRSLSTALRDMDLQNDGRLHAAAQKEASELVLQHQQQNASHQGPETHRNYREHLKKGSHARSHSSGPYAIDMINGSVRARSRAMPVESSHAHDDDVEDPFWTAENTDKVSQQDSQADAIHRGPEPSRVHEFWDSPGKKAYLKLTFSKVAPKPASRRQSSGSRRNISGASGHSLFRNPEDQIYEEPEEDQVLSSKHVTIGDHQSAPLRTREINPSTDPRYERGMPRAKTLPGAKDKVSDFEIHEDKLPLSRNTIQGLRRHPTSTIGENVTEPNESGPRMRNGMEVRSDDIRNATSMKRKDRSPALPSPSFVSKNPERPIVSFDSDYKPRDMDRHQVPVGSTSPNYVTHSARVDISSSVTPPTIEIAAPSIQVESPTLPTTSFEPSETTSRPLPTPSSKAAGPSRAKPKYPLTASLASSSLHHAASVNRGSATCTECHSPIAGRIVSAGGARFHPECFTCFHCGEGLECVAFYPEPEQKRIERLARIEARQSGELVPELDGQGQAEDGDEGLRFYCHLDFHEFFSPRCRSCKTPIEGEVVVACGGEWHVGHFFCAECGDPFDPSTPFVEKDGYAWCVGCHTRRYSTRCRKCRKPVTDTVITALDAEWHAECFCCVECNGELTGGQYFVREEDQDPKPVCQKCEARRLKA